MGTKLDELPAELPLQVFDDPLIIALLDPQDARTGLQRACNDEIGRGPKCGRRQRLSDINPSTQEISSPFVAQLKAARHD